MERSMLKIKRQDHVRYVDLRETSRIKDVVEKTKELKWSWAGHLARNEDARWSKLVIDWISEGFRRRGRPKTRWHDEIRLFAGENWFEVAQDRKIWKEIGLFFVQQ